VRSGEQRPRREAVRGGLLDSHRAGHGYLRGALAPRAARAKLASSCPAEIDHLSISLVLCGFGLT
jgi:hypothetical protein